MKSVGVTSLWAEIWNRTSHIPPRSANHLPVTFNDYDILGGSWLLRNVSATMQGALLLRLLNKNLVLWIIPFFIITTRRFQESFIRKFLWEFDNCFNRWRFSYTFSSVSIIQLGLLPVRFILRLCSWKQSLSIVGLLNLSKLYKSPFNHIFSGFLRGFIGYHGSARNYTSILHHLLDSLLLQLEVVVFWIVALCSMVVRN